MELSNKNKLEKDLDVIVMCGGKCGGTTLTYTLRCANLNTIHIHSFTCSGISNNFNFEVNKTNIINVLNNSKKPIYIIDVYRTPIERKISSFFQNIPYYVPEYLNKSCKELIDVFNNKYIYYLEEYHSINQALTEYNIEHFKEFDFNKGYNIKKVGHLIFIKLLFKDINKWNIILSEIFNKNITLHSDNIRNDNLYKEFLKLYKVPKTYLINNLSQDKEFQIYNTEKEQDLYIQHWTKLSF